MGANFNAKNNKWLIQIQSLGLSSKFLLVAMTEFLTVSDLYGFKLYFTFSKLFWLYTNTKNPDMPKRLAIPFRWRIKDLSIHGILKLHQWRCQNHKQTINYVLGIDCSYVIIVIMKMSTLFWLRYNFSYIWWRMHTNKIREYPNILQNIQIKLSSPKTIVWSKKLNYNAYRDDEKKKKKKRCIDVYCLSLT